jgi:flagellar basal-body rod protein FlgC
MQIGNAFTPASSALRLETQRLSQSARNVASVNTGGIEAQDDAQNVRNVRDTRDQNDVRFDAARFNSDVGGNTTQTYGRNALAQRSEYNAAPSNVDLVEERATQLSSLRSFQANVAALRTQDQTVGELVSRKV